jgi:protein gp37
MTPSSWRMAWPHNVWAGTSAENQQEADKRIPKLLRVPASVRFLSCEPLLGPLDLTQHFRQFMIQPTGYTDTPGRLKAVVTESAPMIHWCIVGGESGPGARPCDAMWIRDILEQCAEHHVAPFVKQLGANCVWNTTVKVKLNDSHGADPDEWPLYLVVREFPNTSPTEEANEYGTI